MEMKKVWAMYFSPTGGTEKVVKGTAEALAAKLGLPLEVYDWTLPGVREKEALFKLKSAPTKEKTNAKKSKFDNYTDTNKPDYSDFAEKILEDMLEG